MLSFTVKSMKKKLEKKNGTKLFHDREWVSLQIVLYAWPNNYVLIFLVLSDLSWMWKIRSPRKK